jgi:hypothetical protein
VNNQYAAALISAITAGSALTNSTTPTSLLPTAALYQLPPNFLMIGSVLRITASYQVTNVVTTPGTLTLDVRFNSTPIVVFNGGAMQMSTTAHTNLPMWVQILLTCRSVGNGTAATLMGQGIATSQCLSLTAVADSTTTPATLLMPNTAPTVGTGFNSVTTNQVDHFATFSVTTATTSITLQQYLLESVN